MLHHVASSGKYREVIAASTDKRCKVTEELVSAISIVKMYCWESSFLEKIIQNRRNEIALIRKRNYIGNALHRIIMSSGKLISIITFTLYFSQTTLGDFRSSDLFVVQREFSYISEKYILLKF